LRPAVPEQLTSGIPTEVLALSVVVDALGTLREELPLYRLAQPAPDGSDRRATFSRSSSRFERRGAAFNSGIWRKWRKLTVDLTATHGFHFYFCPNLKM